MIRNFNLIQRVLARFQLEGICHQDITSCKGGLSGSEVWKVETTQASFCLKRMPTEFSVNRLRAIHATAECRRQRGMTYLARFLPTTTGETFLHEAGHLWELQTWMPGSAPSVPFSSHQKHAMFQAVAEFHRCGDASSTEAFRPTPSPGVQSRQMLLQRWQQESIPALVSKIEAFGHPQWSCPLLRLVDSFVINQSRLAALLSKISNETFSLGDCIGDPRPENFRFQNQELSGLFDLGSMRTDNIALDIARLASEISIDGEVDWQFAFDSTGHNQPLTPSEERLAFVLDAANVLLTGLNWVQWLVLDGYSFADPDQVASRLKHLVDRNAEIDRHRAWSF